LRLGISLPATPVRDAANFRNFPDRQVIFPIFRLHGMEE